MLTYFGIYTTSETTQNSDEKTTELFDKRLFYPVDRVGSEIYHPRIKANSMPELITLLCQMEEVCGFVNAREYVDYFEYTLTIEDLEQLEKELPNSNVSYLDLNLHNMDDSQIAIVLKIVSSNPKLRQLRFHGVHDEFRKQFQEQLADKLMDNYYIHSVALFPFKNYFCGSTNNELKFIVDRNKAIREGETVQAKLELENHNEKDGGHHKKFIR